jgi:hypothetical protein
VFQRQIVFVDIVLDDLLFLLVDAAAVDDNGLSRVVVNDVSVYRKVIE